MNKIYIPFLLVLLLFSGADAAAQFSKWERSYSYPYYSRAITISNPLSSASKSGGGVEYRMGNIAYMVSYYAYRGAYPGLMTDIDLRLYLRKVMKHVTRKWYYQNFLYTRSFVGIAGFDSDKLGFMGYREGVYWYEKLYTGQALGYGRRYTSSIFFITVKAGLRATTFSLDPIEPEARQYYRLFYATGPGSIIELNIQTGIQF